MRHPRWEADRATEHCDRQIARLKEEIDKREADGRDTSAYHRRVKTLECLRGLHEAERRRHDAA